MATAIEPFMLAIERRQQVFSEGVSMEWTASAAVIRGASGRLQAVADEIEAELFATPEP